MFNKSIIAIFFIISSYCFLAYPAHAGAILIFGNHEPPRSDLAGALASLGNTVTISDSLPNDLSQYTTIWHESLLALTTNEQSRLAAFVENGGSLALNGEYSFGNLNASVGVLASQLTGLNITLSPNNALDSFANFVVAAIDGISSTPNLLSTFNTNRFEAKISGSAIANVIANYPSGGVAAVAWDEHDIIGGKGKLLILGDSNWPQLTTGNQRIAVTENLQTFLDGGSHNIPEPNTIFLMIAGMLSLVYETLKKYA